MIDENTKIGIVLPSHMIPDGSKITKVTGTTEYVLRHNLVLYQNQDPSSKVKPVSIEGTFLVDTRGNISQIDPNMNLMLWETALDMRDWLTEMIEGDENPQ